MGTRICGQRGGGNLSPKMVHRQSTKNKVAKLLRKYGLDESAIEGQAFKRSAAVLAMLDRMVASAESRRSKALRNIAEWNAIFAERLRATSDQIIESKTLAIVPAQVPEKRGRAAIPIATVLPRA
jgi:hypothetical protein